MTVPAPLRSTIGQPATGKEYYFERPHITKQVQRALNQRRNILISAPRRIGKSSLLKYLTTQSKEEQVFKYLSIQSTSCGNSFFKSLFHLLIQDSQIMGEFGSYSKRASTSFNELRNRFRSISIEGGFEVSGSGTIDYFEECLKLFETLKGKQIVILLDEFPDAVNNISNISHEQAISFLQKTRELRQLPNQPNVQFIYTGSTGLANVVRKLGKIDLINDLFEIKVTPLTKQEATNFVYQLILGHQLEYAEFKIDENTIQYIIQKVTWPLPYYLQIIIEGLATNFDHYGTVPTIQAVDELLDDMIKANPNYNANFEYWLQRLEEHLSKTNQEAAIEILNHIAIGTTNTVTSLKTLPTLHTLSTLKQLLKILEHDGYINENQGKYSFNSYLLQQWWIKHVAK